MAQKDPNSTAASTNKERIVKPREKRLDGVIDWDPLR
jgi:hypothetical protein